MKRTLYETELFYSKEAALGPHIEEKGTKGLKKWLCLMFLEHPHPQKKSPASQHQYGIYTRKGPANRLWSTLPLFFRNNLQKPRAT